MSFGGRWLEELVADLTFAVRQLRRAPGFALVAALTLALGIGANSAIFALVDATLLRPLPFPDSDRLVMIWERSEASARGRVSPMNMLDWGERSQSLEGIAGYVPSVGGMVMASADGATEDVPRQWLPSPNIFEVLGIRALAGRTFHAEDARERRNVLVMSEGFWQSRFNADPSIVGRDIRLDGDPFTVIGVVPNSAKILGDASVWALRPFDPDPALRSPRVLLAVARLKPDATIAAASADLTSVAAALAQEYPATNNGYGVTIEPFRDAIVGSDLRTTSLLFLGVVGFVLLICCANVANLLLARATVRGRELAVRTSLGATRRRIVRQLVTESLLLACIGGVLGVAVGMGLLAIAPIVVPAGLLPGAVTLAFDTRVLTFCAAAVLFVGITFGLAPAWQASRAMSAQAQISESRTTTGGGRHLRNLLVVAEVATAVLLLFGAGLLLRTLAVVDNIDRGYRAEGTLTMVVDPLGSSYPTAAALQQFFDQVENEIRATPGVKDVAWASTLPLGASFAGQFSFDVLGNPPVDPANRPTADYQIVSRRYFSTLDLPILQGRAFEEHDTRDRTPVCIVNEAFARRHFGGRSAIGAQVALRPAGAPQAKPVVREIVGVARQVKGRPDESDDLLQVYVPMTQQLMDDMFLIVQPSSGSGSALASSVRAAIARVDKAQLVGVRSLRTLDDVAWTATARHRFRAVLVVTFAVLALTLAMVGVFGTLAYTVQQRRREFGLRMALGATGASVFTLVLANAARVVVTGVVIGLLLAAMSARTLQSVIFGVEPLDATTFALVTAVLGVTALAASAAPAWRATRVDPSQTLRQD